MGIAAYNRGSKRISDEGVTADLKHQERVSAKNYQDVLRINEETITAQAAKIAELEAELNRAKLYVQLRKDERDVAREELADTTNKLEHMTSDRNEWRARCILVQQKHQKLSGIVRLALTPDKYHLYRTAYENSEGD